jgi:RNA polymerase sigma factor (sigma-70 family)
MSNPSPSSSEARALPVVAPTRGSSPERELVVLLQRARVGDPNAWTRLVRRFDRVLRRIARSYRLTAADVDDVVQTTWLELFEAIERIREPAAIGGWLATVTRRHALRRRQAHVREQLTDDPHLGDRPDDDQAAESLLALERSAILADALDRLPDRHRDLLTVLLTQPALEYREVGQRLSMPVGSIGPTRARALALLARDAQLCALRDSPVTPKTPRA